MRSPYLISIAISTVSVVMTIPGIWGVERFGRRRLLLIGASGMSICEYAIAIMGSTTSQDNRSAQSAQVAFVCFYIAFFAATLGPVGWVVTGEIYPLRIRAKAMSLSTASIWLVNFCLSFASEPSPPSHVRVCVKTHPIRQHLTCLAPGPETQTSARKYSIFGARRVLAAPSLRTCAFQRQRVSHLSRSTCSTRTWPPFTRCRTASNSLARAAPKFRTPEPSSLLTRMTTWCQMRQFENRTFMHRTNVN
jgi:hypothetical protein